MKKICVVLAVMLFVVNCQTATRLSSAAPSTQQERMTRTEKVPDKGDFKIGSHAMEKGGNRKITPAIRDSQEAFSEIVKELNKLFNLPFDIFISFEECLQANAFYDPETKQISICYELVAGFYETFRNEAANEGDLDDKVAGAVAFTLFHELGHALIDAWDLPITGKEEDAVDQLSTVVLVLGADEGEEMAINGAIAFGLESDDEDLDFADEHSLNQQRFYNIICLIYGQNPKKYKGLVKEEILPKGRAEGCEYEFAKIQKSWLTLLTPYMKV
jgi:hypothetical protein